MKNILHICKTNGQILEFEHNWSNILIHFSKRATSYYSYFSELFYFDQGLYSRTKIKLFNFFHGGIIPFITLSVLVEYFRMKNCTSFTFNGKLFAKMKNAGQITIVLMHVSFKIHYRNNLIDKKILT